MGRLIASLVAAAALGSPAAGVQVHGSQYGSILFDQRGYVLYGFTGASCTGDCAKAWPPFLTKGSPRVLHGAVLGKLGTVRRADGTRQVTYAGHPLYYYVGDRSPGQILCQNVSEFGGLWLVVRGSGRLVR